MALYSMLPEAKAYLKKGGLNEQKAGFLLMGCFVGGFVGIQIISRLFHRFLPSHVVDCDHTHDDPADEVHSHSHSHSHAHSLRSSHSRTLDKHYDNEHEEHHDHGHHGHNGHNGHNGHHSHAGHANGHATESSPLLPAPAANGQTPHERRATSLTVERRPSFQKLTKKVASFITDRKANCDDAGPCYGYSDPCGQECFTFLSSRSNSNANIARTPTFMVTRTGNLGYNGVDMVDEDDVSDAPSRPAAQRRTSRARSREFRHQLTVEHEHPAPDEGGSAYSGDLESQHHHHVPENAFLSIGIQTSIAIALHKFPEGFITYATNHANPSLGFSVFLALFVHNISEGFAMALPLYMALNSRVKAMAWSFVLGGLSQPLGAGIAVLWFKLAKHTHMTPDAVAYGCLFAATAGIMASVALQLFVESLSLNHNRTMNILFAFLGMTLLGISSAFTSEAH